MFPIARSPAAAPRRKKKSSVEQNRDRVTAATLALILENGTDNLNLSDICAKAELSRATFYRHFSGINDVIDGVVDFVVKRFSLDIDAVILENPKIESRIDAICDVLGSSTSIELSRSLLRSDINFMIDLGRKTRMRTLDIFHEAMQPVYLLAEEMFGTRNSRLITDVIGRVHVSFSIYPEEDPILPPPELLKFVFRSLLK